MASKPMGAAQQMSELDGAMQEDGTGMGSGLAMSSDAMQQGPGSAAIAARGASAVERRRVALLARTLETEVIPRLVLAKREPNAPAYLDTRSGTAPTAEDVSCLVGLVLQNDVAGGVAYMGALRARGVPIERLYLELLAPVARQLGEMWEQDRCDFTAVTIGLCCLQQLVMEHSAAFRPRTAPRNIDRRILLSPLPGEQHSFGLLMVGEFFRRQGWDVHSATGADARELAALARRQWFSMVGLSMSCDTKLDQMAATIREVRRASRNPHLGVLVGGRVFTEQPGLASIVGADATAVDGQQAVLKAETLLALVSRDD